MSYKKKHFILLMLISLLTLLLITGCPEKKKKKPPPKKETPLLIKTDWTSLGLIMDDSAFRNLGQACERSLKYYEALPPGRVLEYGEKDITVAQAKKSLKTLMAIVEDPGMTPEEKKTEIENRFDLFMSKGSDGNGSVLFTGYYEPVLEGSLKPDKKFRYPIYKRPHDLLTIKLRDFPTAQSDRTIYGRVNGESVVPYYTREEIDQEKKIDGRGLELAWFSDPVDIFFLQIQGSGRLDLGKGNVLHVLYDGKNGHPYVSLGRHLIDKGLMKKDDVSMEKIRKFLSEHPEIRREMLNVNPSYTFFRFSTKGPFGNINVALTPYRSIATDATVFPKGAPCMIQSEKPVIDQHGKVIAWTPFTRFVMNQDTGGAIKGPGRVDLFCGAGPEASKTAGAMKNPGKLYFLLEKGILE